MYVHDAANELKGVEVVVQKPLVKSDIDKIEYNISDDPDSKSNTMLEMLRKVPLVTVDGDETIKVNGSSSFKVYVNGRPNNMMSNNPKEVLKSLPANSVKRVEVITKPRTEIRRRGCGRHTQYHHRGQRAYGIHRNDVRQRGQQRTGSRTFRHCEERKAYCQRELQL